MKTFNKKPCNEQWLAFNTEERLTREECRKNQVSEKNKRWNYYDFKNLW